LDTGTPMKGDGRRKRIRQRGGTEKLQLLSAPRGGEGAQCNRAAEIAAQEAQHARGETKVGGGAGRKRLRGAGDRHTIKRDFQTKVGRHSFRMEKERKGNLAPKPVEDEVLDRKGEEVGSGESRQGPK